jgi:hypothetical protein
MRDVVFPAFSNYLDSCQEPKAKLPAKRECIKKIASFDLNITLGADISYLTQLLPSVVKCGHNTGHTTHTTHTTTHTHDTTRHTLMWATTGTCGRASGRTSRRPTERRRTRRKLSRTGPKQKRLRRPCVLV